MTAATVEPASRPAASRRASIACASGLIAGLVAAWIFFLLTPSLLDHHSLLLEALNGTTAAIIGGGAFARVGSESLLLVVVAPFATIALYDVFWWWGGTLWGEKLIGLYTANSPRARRWVDRAERFVRRRGILALIAGYFLPIPNFLIYICCGLSGMSLVVFALGDAIGLLLWEGMLIALGWAIGHPAVRIVDDINHYSLYITIGLVVVALLFSAFRVRRQLR